jgi:hypothetical protein
MMLTQSKAVKEELLHKIETLPDYKLQEVLDFVEFLLLKDKSVTTQPTDEQYTQQEILAELTYIRETVNQTYGIYNGDLVAEARAERIRQIDLNLEGVKPYFCFEYSTNSSYSQPLSRDI